jgi:hypothetical protein
MLTLLEASKLVTDPLKRGVIEIFPRTSPVPIAFYILFERDRENKTQKQGQKPFGNIVCGVWLTADPKYQNALPRTAAYLPIEIQP